MARERMRATRAGQMCALQPPTSWPACLLHVSARALTGGQLGNWLAWRLNLQLSHLRELAMARKALRSKLAIEEACLLASPLSPSFARARSTLKQV